MSTYTRCRLDGVGRHKWHTSITTVAASSLHYVTYIRKQRPCHVTLPEIPAKLANTAPYLGTLPRGASAPAARVTCRFAEFRVYPARYQYPAGDTEAGVNVFTCDAKTTMRWRLLSCFKTFIRTLRTSDTQSPSVIARHRSRRNRHAFVCLDTRYFWRLKLHASGYGRLILASEHNGERRNESIFREFVNGLSSYTTVSRTLLRREQCRVPLFDGHVTWVNVSVLRWYVENGGKGALSERYEDVSLPDGIVA